MALINLTTDLKSLKFGHDELGGGSSNQPYIVSSIPDVPDTDLGINASINIVSNPGNSSIDAETIIKVASVVGATAGAIIGATTLGEYIDSTYTNPSPDPQPIPLPGDGQLDPSIDAVGFTAAALGGVAGAALGIAAGTGISAAAGILPNGGGINASLGVNIPSTGTGGPDWIVRGNKLLPNALLNDFKRITKFFASTEGQLFTLKQNILSKSATPTQATRTLSSNAVLGNVLNPLNLNPLVFNQGVYNPASTLMQVLGGALGLHVEKQGLFTTRPYSKIVKRTEEQKDNRLVALYASKISFVNLPGINKDYIGTDPNILFNYPGGPNSVLGIGRTRIHLNNPTIKPDPAVDFQDPTKNYVALGHKSLLTEFANSNIVVDGDTALVNTRGFRGYVPNINQKDFRKVINKLASGSNGGKDIIPSSDYEPYGDGFVIETNRNLGDPGNPNGKDLINGVNIPGVVEGANPASPNSYDRINAYPIYKTDIGNTIENTTTGPRDLIQFRIGVINYDLLTDVADLGQSSKSFSLNPNNVNYIQFRAYLDQISDSYSSDWSDFRYLGRGEKFYNYVGFDRKLSLSWTVAAQSRVELIPMYKKLNYLASICAPNYSSTGYMRGNFILLTIGGYLNNHLGIITGFNYEMNDANATWDVDYELPHLIRVTGFNFIPIHNFVPKLQDIQVNKVFNVEENSNLNIEDDNIYSSTQFINNLSPFNIDVTVTPDNQ